MDKTALCKKWQELFNTTAPKHLRKEFMVRILAYKIQENAFGGLSAPTLLLRCFFDLVKLERARKAGDSLPIRETFSEQQTEWRREWDSNPR